jgi:predicted nucleic acid-binding OB-fold protein
METLQIDIVNPKAKKIIKNLAALNLINIRKKKPAQSFQDLLNRLRRHEHVPSLREIIKEVEIVRANKHAKKN